jgi:formimidoylglutamate deiminase
VLRLEEALQGQVDSCLNFNVGVAIHSLRAADAAAIQELAAEAHTRGLPVHIHIAEQTQEVQDCLAHTGQRPIEWLMAHVAVHAQWNLVHATHATPAELQAVQRSGAAIVICPSTEANLGDGVFDFPAFARLGGRWSVGSDSHVSRSWVEELRLLEYAQRLTLRQRNVAALAGADSSSAAALFEAALAAGPQACSRPLGGLQAGQRADFLVLDAQSPALLGVPAQQLLDALVFSSPAARFSAVFVGGQQRVAEGVIGHDIAAWRDIQQGFVRAMAQLWG